MNANAALTGVLRHPPGRLRLNTDEDHFGARTAPLEPISAQTQLSVAESDLADIAANFPSPPTHIPPPRTPQALLPPSKNFALRTPAEIEHYPSAAPTSRESVFSIDRITTNFKRVFKRAVRAPTSRKSRRQPNAPSPPPIIVTTVAEAFRHNPPAPDHGPRSTNKPLEGPEPLFLNQHSTYTFVDPSTLTRTPSAHRLGIPISESTAFLPQSPSWILSKVVEFESHRNSGIGLSLEIERQIQKVPTPPALLVASRIAFAPGSTTSLPLSSLDVHEEGHEITSNFPFGRNNLHSIPLASRTNSQQSKLSFTTANSEFSANTSNLNLHYGLHK